MSRNVDLVTPAERAIGLLKNKGLDFYDVTVLYSRQLSIGILGKGINEARSRTDLGIGIRAFKHKGMGIAFSQSLEPSDVEQTVQRATDFAGVAQPDPYFKSIPGPLKSPEVPGLCDDEVITLTLEDAGRRSKQMIDAVEEVRKGATFTGGMTASHYRDCLITSTGVSVESEKTYLSAFLGPTFREGDDIGHSYEYDFGISLGSIDFEWIGKRAAEKASEQLGSRVMRSGTLPIILTPDAVGSLCMGLLFAVSGEQVVKGRTFASDYLGQQIASELLDIDENGTLEGAIESNTYDGEGVPRKPTKIVRDGRLLTFLHNSYSAGIAGVETTGHARREGYRGYVGAGPTNVQVRPGDSSLNEMMTETRNGILVTRADFYPNIVSGELSSTIDEGFLIEGGEKKQPVHNLMLGGHILELYKDIALISREGRTLGKGHFFPSMKISQVKLAGQ